MFIMLSYLMWSVAQLCLTLCDLMNCSPPSSSVHGILQARTLEQVAISFFRGSSWSRNQTHVSCASCIGRQILYHWATEENHYLTCSNKKKLLWCYYTNVISDSCRSFIPSSPRKVHFMWPKPAFSLKPMCMPVWMLSRDQFFATLWTCGL